MKGFSVAGLKQLLRKDDSAPVGGVSGGTDALRAAHPGALAALLAVAVGGLFLFDPSAKDSAWASLPAPTKVQQPVLQIDAAAAIERGIQPSALGSATPFHFTALAADTRARAEQCLAEAVYYEAGSESEEGQRAVAQVVLNRVRHGAFPNSVCGVVYQGAERTTGCQFTFTCDGSLARLPSRSGWQRALAVARRALDGEVYAPVGHATHYHATWMRPYWASSVALIGRIGGHLFYSWKGATGSAAAFAQAYAGLEVKIAPDLVQQASATAAAVLPEEIGPRPSDANPALGDRVRGADALEDPANADLLNYRSAAGEGPATKADESQVVRAINSAL